MFDCPKQCRKNDICVCLLIYLLKCLFTYENLGGKSTDKTQVTTSVKNPQ